jgi:hypothetical protein
MPRKVQVWLRLDQAECAVAALEYVIARFNGHGGSADQPAIRLATKLARERSEEVAAIFNEAIAKLQQTPAAVGSAPMTSEERA